MLEVGDEQAPRGTSTRYASVIAWSRPSASAMLWMVRLDTTRSKDASPKGNQRMSPVTSSRGPPRPRPRRCARSPPPRCPTGPGCATGRYRWPFPPATGWRPGPAPRHATAEVEHPFGPVETNAPKLLRPDPELASSRGVPVAGRARHRVDGGRQHNPRQPPSGGEQNERGDHRHGCAQRQPEQCMGSIDPVPAAVGRIVVHRGEPYQPIATHHSMIASAAAPTSHGMATGRERLRRCLFRQVAGGATGRG
jgi:hypothetical protein